MDVIGFSIVTIGNRACEVTRDLYRPVLSGETAEAFEVLCYLPTHPVRENL
jgi:hypothetical protein